MTTSARRSSASPRTVMRPGSPGPAPTSATTPTRTPRPAAARDGGVDAAVVGGGERERGAREVTLGVRPRDMRDPPRGRQRRERRRERRTHHRDHGAGGEEALDLALGDRAAAEHDARPALQLDEERKQRHGYASTPAGSRPPAGSRSTAGTGLPASSARSVA